MKILVPIKRVIDAYAKIRVKPDQTGVDTQHVKMVINPFDEIAIEAALKLKEAGQASEVVVVSIGDQSVPETLRTGLALGADRALHIEAAMDLEPLLIAKLLAAVVARENPQLVIMGKQSIDGDNNQTGQMLAAKLDWPQATFVSEITVQSDAIHVTREIDGGLEQLAVTLPAVITTDLRLNVPRYASLPSIMKAKQKPLQTIAASELHVDCTPRVTTLKVTPPPVRESQCRMMTVPELVNVLHEQDKVI